MRHRRLNRSRAFGEINVTPLIDVVMCLIIFYLMVGKLAGDRRAHVELPKTTVGAETGAELFVVNVVPVSGDGWPGPGAQVIVDRAVITDAETLERLVRDRMGSAPSTVVQVRAEKDLAWPLVSPVLSACTRGGASSVRLATERVAPTGGTP